MLAQGCVKMDTVLSLRRDGSGTLDISYSVTEEVVDRIKAMQTLHRELTPPEDAAAAAPLYAFFDPSQERLEAAVRKLEKYGVKAEDLVFENREVSRHVRARLYFEDLAKLAKAPAFQQYGFNLTRNAQGDYVLSRPSRTRDASADLPYGDPEVTRNLGPMLEGFRVDVRIETPGRILDTNASRSSPTSAMWSFDFARDPAAVAAFRDRDLTVVFDGRGLSLPLVMPRDE